MTDRLRLIEVPSELTDGCRQAILDGWQQGIQDERDYHGVHEFKLRGNPWVGTGSQSVGSRALLGSVLTCMARNGWTLLQSSDVSKKPDDKHTLFFEYVHPDPEAQIFAISFNMTDRIRVIGATGVMPAVKNAVETHWKYGIQDEREYCGSPELKLCGNPWLANGKEAVLVRILLNHILSDMRALGFKLYGSIDLSGDMKGMDLETWYFRRVGLNWA